MAEEKATPGTCPARRGGGAGVGVYVCNCGTNIAKTVDVAAVAGAMQEEPGVVVARSYKYMCSNPGQEMIAQDVKELGLQRVVVAACSPRMHEPTFRRALERGGLNPYFLEVANIREHCSWIHEDGQAATDKAKALTRAAIERVRFHEALEKRSVPMCPATLVLGGGVAGLTAALELADADQQVYLVEQADELGGNVARLDLTVPWLDSARDVLRERISRVRKHPRIKLFLGAKLVEVKGFVGNFKPTIRTEHGQQLELEVGSVVVCTGYQEFDPTPAPSYGYGALPDVITSFELEAMLRRGKIETRSGPPRSVAIIHCVGSRSKKPGGHPYCSRVCCATALKFTVEVRAALPQARVSSLYVDMRAFGKGYEALYKRSSEAKTTFFMFSKEDLPTVRLAGPDDGCNMLVTVREQLSGEEIEVPADLVVLMVGMEPRADAEEVARLVNISRDKDGWFIESHPKLDPVATTTDGVFIAGACQAPKDIPDSVAQARAAAARILAKIARHDITVDGVYAEVEERACSGCRICNTVCAYSAMQFDPKKGKSYVVSAACKACGCCVAACPSGAVKLRHFNDEQVFAQIEGVL